MAMAGDNDIVIKQHVIYTLDNFEAKNVTAVTIGRTDATKGILATSPDWVKMIIDGWNLEVGVAYEDTEVGDGAVLLTRDFGTLGEYVPWLIFPFKDRIHLSFDVGAYLPGIQHSFDPEMAAGAGWLKGSLDIWPE